MTDDKSYGWTGRILRVNLSTESITIEPTEPYKLFIGGMGIANKIMYDEVPEGTDPLSPENKIVFATGPLTATGTPLAGRTTICSLSTFSKDNLIIDAHTGGMIGARLKQSGHDILIIEGASDKPVYINIDNDEVTIKDARDIWGLGTRDCNEYLCRKEGTEAVVASIGPAGENLLPYSVIISARNHSAGAGVGAVMGSKKCKAVVVKGTGTIHLADPQTVADLSDYMLREVVGSNNNHVVPSTQQEWAEFYDEGSRWTARKGLYWGAAEGGPVETGEPKPGEINTVGYRCMKATKDLGPEAEKYTVKMDGCHGCPIHCFADLRIEKVSDLTGFKGVGNTCVTAFPVSIYADPLLKMGLEDDNELAIIWNTTAGALMDDLGLWCNYAQLWRDIAYCHVSGVFKRVLPPEEYDSLDWGKFDADRRDPSILVDLLTKISRNDSEIAYVAYGPYTWCERWGEQKWFDDKRSKLVNYRGWPVHHANECFGQVGAIYNMFFNRDCMVHSAVNFQGCGLPLELKEEIAAEVWGSKDAVTANKNYTPMNDSKANFSWWSVVTDVLHDSLTLCNWTWPMTMSPSKTREYRGDLDLEAKFFKAVTGEDITTQELYKAGARIMTLQRANTVRGMRKKDGTVGNNNLREDHDVMTQWIFTMDPDKEPFSEGTEKMEPEDFQLGLTMVYEKFGWDPKYGCPTAECLDEYGLEDVKQDLEAKGLLP